MVLQIEYLNELDHLQVSTAATPSEILHRKYQQSSGQTYQKYAPAQLFDLHLFCADELDDLQLKPIEAYLCDALLEQQGGN